MFQRGKYGKLITSLFTAVDFVVLNIIFFIVGQIYPGVAALHLRLTWLLLNVAYLPVAKWVKDAHNVRSLQMEAVMRISFFSVIVHALCFVSLLYLMQVAGLRARILFVFYSMFLAGLMLWRVSGQTLLKSYRRGGGNTRKAVIVGNGPTARRLYDEICANPGFGYDVNGVFDIYCCPDSPLRDLYRGNLSELEDYIAENHIDELFYTLSGEDREALRLTLGLCDQHMMKFHYVPQISPYLTRNLRQGQIGAMPVLGVLNNPLESPVSSAVKRLFDIAVSGTFLLVSPIVLIPVAIAIKVSSPGPVFFRQKRTGYMGKEFWCYKFRTMRVNDDSDSLQASKDDPRKTRVGDFLRRTSIDELPQFLNVLKGDMSVVGPRPHMLKHTHDYSALIRNYMVRHLIKPGITGWAQVHGYRGQTEELWQMQKRVEHDIWYIEHWSLFLDIKIMVRTVINALHKDENAF